jgi:hypothetical protein
MMDGGTAARYKERFGGCLENFMRFLVGAVLAASLLVHGASAEPLAPGRPAGVHAARMTATDTALMLGTGAAIMAAVGILISGNSSPIGTLVINSQNNVVAPPVSTVVSTSTTTTTS